eukprot:750828-Hanusia_phi.AAC.2
MFDLFDTLCDEQCLYIPVLEMALRWTFAKINQVEDVQRANWHNGKTDGQTSAPACSLPSSGSPEEEAGERETRGTKQDTAGAERHSVQQAALLDGFRCLRDFFLLEDGPALRARVAHGDFEISPSELGMDPIPSSIPAAVAPGGGAGGVGGVGDAGSKASMVLEAICSALLALGLHLSFLTLQEAEARQGARIDLPRPLVGLLESSSSFFRKYDFLFHPLKKLRENIEE